MPHIRHIALTWRTRISKRLHISNKRLLETTLSPRKAPALPTPKPIARFKRLLYNARCASAAAENWVDFSQVPNCFDRGDDPYMRPHEIVRFKRAFYRVWAIGVMGMHLPDRASAFLDKCSPRELFVLEDLAEWAINYCDHKFEPSGLNFLEEVWEVGRSLVKERWIVYSDTIDGLPGPDYTHCGFYAFFDNTQRYLEFIPDE